MLPGWGYYWERLCVLVCLHVVSIEFLLGTSAGVGFLSITLSLSLSSEHESRNGNQKSP